MESHQDHLRHNAFIYDSDEQYVERSVPFLTAGLESGEAAIVAGMPDRLAIMREALGPLAGRVVFTSVDSIYRRPARTLAAYHDLLVRSLRAAPGVRAIADVQWGESSTTYERDLWIRYEAICNVSYAHLPAWLVCTHNAQRVSDSVLEGVWRTHPTVLTDDWQTSSHFEDPAQTVRDLTPEPSPLSGLRSVAAGADVEAFRERLALELEHERVPEPRALDLLVSATEIHANAARYGGGVQELRVGRKNGRFVCEITDHGDGFDDPIAGYRVPRDPQTSPKGLWIARQLVWQVEFLRAPGAFTVRLWL